MPDNLESLEVRSEADLDLALRPLQATTRAFYLFMGGLSVLLLYWLFNVAKQSIVGHGLHGCGHKGAAWGIIVANIVHLIGISHVGIAISASVRIMRLKRYVPLARIAELVTMVAMTAAVANIMLDVGRLDRALVNVVLYGRIHAPFVWSMTVISWYVVGSSVYLYLAMRRDLAVCSWKIPKRRWLYRILSVGYTDSPEVRKTHDRTVWWCAVIILPIMVSVHSVYGWVFGLQPGRPGWFNPIMAPYFVLGAIVSGFSAMIIIVAIVRKVYGWHKFIPDRTFKGLGIFLGFVTWLYMYFMFSELLTGQYAPPEAEHVLWNDYLWGRFAWLSWPALIGGLFFPFWLLFIQGVNPRICSVPLTLTAAVFINLALWTIRYLIVVPSFYNPHLPYRIAPYQPTVVEISVMLGTWVLGVFLFTVLLKILPVIELAEEIPVKSGERYVLYPSIQVPGRLKTVVVFATAAGGIGMMCFGFATWYQDYAPVKWLTGIFMLCAVPLELCLLQPVGKEPPYRELRAEVLTLKRASVDRWLVSPSPPIGPLTGREIEP
ncbi:MAG: NrfD/PsrC family molybdoenzyme membrane anchor subunit [Planctomycetota bacterium]|jgi:molybdopterin-containing oxidoreductase family membrane subunit